MSATPTVSHGPVLSGNQWIVLGLLGIAYGVIPVVGGSYLFDAILTPFLVLSLAALGLNLLTGYAGQLSLGTAGFMAVGAYAAFNLSLRIQGLPVPFVFLFAGLVTAAIGLVFGLPSLRLRGFYLAVSTLAAQFLVQWALTKFGWFSNHNASGVIDAPVIHIFGYEFASPVDRYLVTLTVVLLLTALVARLVRTQTGHHLIAIRDNELAARVLGLPVLRTKLLAFGLSSFIVGVAGALWSFAYLRTVEPHGFNLDRSFLIVFIIIIGGLASVRGAFFGAAFLVVFPLLLSRAGSFLLGSRFDSGVLDMSQRIVIGALIITFLIAEPNGLVALWDRLLRRTSPKQPNQTTQPNPTYS